MEGRPRWLLCLLIIILTLSAQAIAQVSASTITGSVTDPSGAVVPGAKVTATNEATGVSYQMTTTSGGAFAFSSVIPGKYTISVNKRGFKTFTSVGNVLTVGVPPVVGS